MGEDRHCADQTRYVCGNSVDDPVLDFWGVADSLVPQEKSAVRFTKPIRSIGEKPHTQNLLAKGRESSSVNEKKPMPKVLLTMALKMPGQVYLAPYSGAFS
jgi:hypothetical protein